MLKLVGKIPVLEPRSPSCYLDILAGHCGRPFPKHQLVNTTLERLEMDREIRRKELKSLNITA